MEVKLHDELLLLLILGSCFCISNGTYVVVAPQDRSTIDRHACCRRRLQSGAEVGKISCPNNAHVKFDSIEICADTFTVAMVLFLFLLAAGALHVYLKRKSLLSSFAQGFTATATRVRSGAFRRRTARAVVTSMANEELHNPTPAEQDCDYDDEQQEQKPQSSAIRTPASAVVQEPKPAQITEEQHQRRFVQSGTMQVAIA